MYMYMYMDMCMDMYMDMYMDVFVFISFVVLARSSTYMLFIGCVLYQLYCFGEK